MYFSRSTLWQFAWIQAQWNVMGFPKASHKHHHDLIMCTILKYHCNSICLGNGFLNPKWFLSESTKPSTRSKWWRAAPRPSAKPFTSPSRGPWTTWAECRTSRAAILVTWTNSREPQGTWLDWKALVFSMPCSDLQLSAAKALFPPHDEKVALATAASMSVCVNAFDCFSFTVPAARCHLHCHSPPSFPPEVLISTHVKCSCVWRTL